MSKVAPYRRKLADAKSVEPVRVVVMMPIDEVEAADEWGVSVGEPNRTACIRSLVRKGLEAAHREKSVAGAA